MSQPELLKSCFDFFNQAQLSWDKYFSKWEIMAREETADNSEEKDYSPFKNVKCKAGKTKKSVRRKRYIKSVARTGKKNNGVKAEEKGKMEKWKKGRGCKSGNQEGGNEIIHKTENQTNLECQVVNNKRFEADLKAIFIEILSENTNKVGMFSVLSRMFPGNGNTTITNISLTSMIMESNEFSINPITSTTLRSSSCNEFPPRGTSPRRLALGATHTKHSGADLDHGLTPVPNESQARLRDRDNLTRLNHGYVKHPGTLSREEFGRGGINRDGGHAQQLPDPFGFRKNETPRYTEGKATISSTTPRREYIHENEQQQKTTVERVNESAPDNKLGSLTSPEATLRKILSPDGIRSEPSRSHHRKRKIKKVNSMRYDSDDDSGDEENNCTADGSPGRFLKIFCTPKRPRRCINSGENDSAPVASNPDDEECFDIVDRVKNTGA